MFHASPSPLFIVDSQPSGLKLHPAKNLRERTRTALVSQGRRRCGIIISGCQTAARSHTILYWRQWDERQFGLSVCSRNNHSVSVMSLLVANQISKNYGDLDVFENVNLRIEVGDRIGLVGPNGAGKTSLLKALAQLDATVRGEMFIARDTRIGYLPQDPPPAGNSTLFDDLKSVFANLLAQGEELRRLEARMTQAEHGEEQLAALLTRYGRKQDEFERAGGYQIDQRVRFVLTGLGLKKALWEAPVNHLSGGQRTRAGLGRLLLEEPDLLLLDEPTNHLDVMSMGWLEGVLKGWKGALVIVSHDRYFLDSVATRIWDLAHLRLESYKGNYSHYRLQREERRSHWRKEYERQQKFVRDTEEFIRRYKAGQRTKEAQGRETRLKRFLQEKALPPPPTEQTIRLPLRTDTRSGDLVLRTRKLIAGYQIAPPSPTENRRPASANAASGDVAQGSTNQALPGSTIRDKVNASGPSGSASGPQGRLRAMRSLTPTDIPILKIPDLDLHRGQVAALIGPNGAGKTTFVRTILEELEPLTGRAELGASVELGYLAQRHVGSGYGLMNGSQTVLDSLLEIKRLPTERARTYLGQFLFKGDDVFQTVDNLSGGQRSRIALARLTLQGANFLLLDEPTNHLDLDSQEILQDALRQFNGTILLVTHDRALIQALATQIWHIEEESGEAPNRLDLFKGAWSQWQTEQANSDLSQDPLPAAADPDAANDDRERQRSARRKRRLEQRQEQIVAEKEERISRLEGNLVEIEHAMAQASLAQELQQLQILQERHRSISLQLDALVEEWSALAA